MSRAIQMRTLRPGDPPVMEFYSGKELPKSVAMMADRITIGRSPSNDIVLSGDGVSREHAILERMQDGRYLLSDKGSKNGIQINGQTVTEVVLTGGEVLQIGTYTFRFYAPPATEEAPEPGGAPALYEAEAAAPRRNNKRLLIYGIGGLLLALVLYVSNDSSTPKAKAPDTSIPEITGAATEPPALDSINAPDKSVPRDPIMSPAEDELAKLDAKNTALREAEQYFKKGLRDYETKNYHRAMESFRAALSYNRSHPLAEYYFRLSVYAADNEAKKHFEIGRKYFESMQFQRAMYHFSEVGALLIHRPNQKLANDAQKYLDLCRRRLEASEFIQ